MSSIDSVAQKYRGLYLTAMAQGLEQLIGNAEANGKCNLVIVTMRFFCIQIH